MELCSNTYYEREHDCGAMSQDEQDALELAISQRALEIAKDSSDMRTIEGREKALDEVWPIIINAQSDDAKLVAIELLRSRTVRYIEECDETIDEVESSDE